ncbi:MAG: carboxypeptidase regulatory-like domain-containing protein [Lentimicrobiaceae bacterium]|jgi:PKD repeat protein|nr:carboxypeptidase regulatory-like domain-containing protein [Lentimicrobiaceae bacterium]
MKTVKIAFCILLACLFHNQILAQFDLEKALQTHPEVYFSLKITEKNTIEQLDKIVSIDRFDGEELTAYATREQFEKILTQGFEPVVLTPPSLQEIVEMFDFETSRGVYEWDSYPTYEAYETMMQQFGTNHSSKCTIVNLGTLNSGRKILMANINNGTTEGKPKFLYTSSMHGDELTGYVLMLRLIDYLLTNYDSNTRIKNIVDNLDIWINPLANPDGAYRTGNSSVNGATRANANGVDLNRNYHDPKNGPHPDGNPYQQETEIFMEFAQTYPISMAANFHGGAEVVNYPWDTWSHKHADDSWWQLVSREYANYAQTNSPSGYMTDLTNGITNGYAWYTITGSRQDYMNYFASCREVTVEISEEKTPSGSQLPNFWNYNLESLLHYMEQNLNGIHGTVTNAETGEPIEALVYVETHDKDHSEVYSHLPSGNYNRLIKSGTYNVTFSKTGYYPQTHRLTVTDNQRLDFHVQLQPGTLIPDFEATQTLVSLGETIDFDNLTFGEEISSYIWTFEGAEPAFSNDENPKNITYNEKGTYSVSLTVTNKNGEVQKVTKENYISVSSIYTMPRTGTVTITTNSGTIYDDGGPEDLYSDNCSATMIVNPDSRSSMIHLEGSYETESDYDYLTIYDGVGTSGTVLGHYSGGGTVSLTSTVGALTIKFTSDQSIQNEGFALEVSCVNPAHTAHVTGTVVSKENTSLAVSNALVSFGNSYTKTNESGIFEMDLEPNTYDITVLAEGYEMFDYQAVIASGNSTFHFELTPLACVMPKYFIAIPDNFVIATTLSWTGHPFSSEYQIFRDDELIDQVSETYYYDTDLEGNKNYCYMIEAVCSEGNSVATETVCVTTAPLGLTQQNENQMQIYPNPAKETISIVLEQLNTVVLRNMLGQKVLQYDHINTDTFRIDVSHLQSDMYMLEATTNNGSCFVSKVVLTK